MSIKLLAFAGSARKDSWNRKIAAVAADGARHAGAAVTVINLGDYPMPIYHGDDEASAGLPDGAAALQHIMRQHHGYLIAAAEYNSSITPLLKNAIDWTTRVGDGSGTLECWQNKTAAIVAASPGGLGGLRALRHVREILSSIHVHVMPAQLAVPAVHTLFDDDGSMTDEATRDRLHGIGASLVDYTSRLIG